MSWCPTSLLYSCTIGGWKRRIGKRSHNCHILIHKHSRLICFCPKENAKKLQPPSSALQEKRYQCKHFSQSLLMPCKKGICPSQGNIPSAGRSSWTRWIFFWGQVYLLFYSRPPNLIFSFSLHRPCSLDAIVFGHLAVHLAARLESPKLRALLLAHKNLEEYCKRLLKQLFDYDLESLPPAVAIETDDKTENQESQVYSAMAKYGLVGGFIGLFIAARWWNSRHE